MKVRRKTVFFSLAVVALVAILAVVLLHPFRPRPVILQGAVIRQDSDPNKQQPIAGVEVTVSGESVSGAARSSAAGFFQLSLPSGVRPGQTLTLGFRHSGYVPLQLSEPSGNRLYIAHMIPLSAHAPRTDEHRPETLVANLTVRYSIKSTTAAEVGSAAHTFQAVNVGNVPCDRKSPCSPDGKWKAAIGSGTLDAGEGNEFRNVRVSCIAGPCPFTRIDPNQISQGGRIVKASVLNWSDTTTFLIEAEVFRPGAIDLVRTSYPIVFGRTINFSLPAEAEGPSIEAEVGGAPIVFPLGPSLCLSWADCTLEVDHGSGTYRCELKPGYRF
jgi:hypothetical protein